MRRFVFSMACSLSVACGDGASGSGGTDGSGGAGGGGAGSTSVVATTGTTSSTGGAGPGSGGGPPEVFCQPGLPVVSFAADVQPLLTASCAKATCHTGSFPDASLDLSVSAAHAETVGVETFQCNGARTRVVPGDPGASYLFDKVRGADLCGTSRRMPPSPNPMLSQAERDVLEAWICAGAPND